MAVGGGWSGGMDVAANWIGQGCRLRVRVSARVRDRVGLCIGSGRAVGGRTEPLVALAVRTRPCTGSGRAVGIGLGLALGLGIGLGCVLDREELWVDGLSRWLP